MTEGWVKLYRSLLVDDLWLSDEPFDKRAAYIDVLMMANYDASEIVFGNHVSKVKPGEAITSEVKLAERWHWSRGKVRRFIDEMVRTGKWTCKRTPSCTSIFVINPWKNQGDKTHGGQGNGTRDGTHNKNIKNTSSVGAKATDLEEGKEEEENWWKNEYTERKK